MEEVLLIILIILTALLKEGVVHTALAVSMRAEGSRKRMDAAGASLIARLLNILR